VRGVLVDQGFTEVYNYSFLSEEAVLAFGFEPAAHLRVSNPIASDQALMRSSLLPGIRKNILENAKHREAFRLFEIGLEIHKTEQRASASGPGGGQLPDEVPHLVAAVYDRTGDGASGLFEVKRVALCLMREAEAQPVAARPFEHPARAAELRWRGQAVGRIFELHPTLVETGRAAILDLDLRTLRSLAVADFKYAPVRRYPASAFDLSVIAGARELAGVLETAIRGFAGPLLESTQFLRQYSGPPLEEGRKSVSFRLTVGSADRTLSLDEVGAIRAAIIAGMRGLGYELRV
jgi:phenylalanyl-tRNA synthetase beta chain